jgi:hypothetical protein
MRIAVLDAGDLNTSIRQRNTMSRYATSNAYNIEIFAGQWGLPSATPSPNVVLWIGDIEGVRTGTAHRALTRIGL